MQHKLKTKREGERAQEQWMEQYNKLVNFVHMHYHGNVPQDYPEDKSFGFWIKRQRTLYKQKQLADNREKLLDAIGIVWEPWEKRWIDWLDEARIFKTVHSHVRIPDSSSNAGLYHWVQGQRLAHANGRLNEQRITLMENVRFCFGGGTSKPVGDEGMTVGGWYKLC